jgi:exodeoxyribonuclease VII large subunit
MLDRTLSVSQLSEYIYSMFALDTTLTKIRVSGELSNFKRYTSGHMYFSLKDSEALLRCVMFKGNANRLTFVPKDGMRVDVLCNVSWYKKDGQCQLYVQEMRSYGEGDLYAAFEQLKKKLGALGMFDEQHKKKIPLLPRQIGVITSPTGAVIHDMMHVIKRRYPQMDLLLCPVSVQGSEAVKSNIQALRYFNEMKDVDVIILGRGGGSAEDLNAYNDEGLAYAIFESDIPIVTAIGHETDFTIADFVSDMRAPTPSAAAELCVPIRAELEQQLNSLSQGMKTWQSRLLENNKAHLVQLHKRLQLLSPQNIMRQRAMQADALHEKLLLHMRKALDVNRARVDACAGKLAALDPGRVVKRGYAILKKNGRVVQRTVQLQKDDEIQLLLMDGQAGAVITDIEQQGED